MMSFDSTYSTERAVKPVKPVITIWEYMKKIMSRSLITGLSAILSTSSCPRKVFKVLVLLACLVGFFYQTTSFLLYFITFPSIVDIDITIPPYITKPDFTFCNYNGLKRTKFCKKYPDRCYIPENRTEFCEYHKKFCKAVDEAKGDLLIPKPEYELYEVINATDEEVKELGHSREEILFPERITGPYVIHNMFGVKTSCFCENFRYYDAGPSNSIPTEKMGPNEVLGAFAFMPLLHEVFHPARQTGIMFDVHSPFEIGAPFERGIFIRAGRAYIVRIRIEEEYMLEYPYKHNCMNYEDLRSKSNGIGPTSQQVCLLMCYMKWEIMHCNCSVQADRIVPEDVRCTTEEDIACTRSITYDEMSSSCNSECHRDCRLLKYKLDVQERYVEREFLDATLRGIYERRSINVTIQLPYSYVIVYLVSKEVTIYRHKPQYQENELFSYIGGFIGIWLGVSLVAIVDMLEGFAAVGLFCISRYTNMNRVDRTEDNTIRKRQKPTYRRRCKECLLCNTGQLKMNSQKAYV